MKPQPECILSLFEMLLLWFLSLSEIRRNLWTEVLAEAKIHIMYYVFTKNIQNSNMDHRPITRWPQSSARKSARPCPDGSRSCSLVGPVVCFNWAADPVPFHQLSHHHRYIHRRWLHAPFSGPAPSPQQLHTTVRWQILIPLLASLFPCKEICSFLLEALGWKCFKNNKLQRLKCGLMRVRATHVPVS